MRSKKKTKKKKKKMTMTTTLTTMSPMSIRLHSSPIPESTTVADPEKCPKKVGPNSTNAAYVPAKANTTRPRVNNTADTDTDTDTDTDRVALQLRETCAPPNDQTEVTIQRLQETTETMTMQLEPPENLPSTVEHISRMTQTSIIARESTEAIAVQIAEIPSVDEEWTTPATQQFGLFIIISSRAAYGEDRAS
ncbi:hypothetical protein LTR96_011034 [Exophiala xenobiotica]|nr:hypothetical protein LTR96_011034 [Exophiala xenobiotica]